MNQMEADILAHEERLTNASRALDVDALDRLYVLIHSEMIHEARIIPLDGRPHQPQAIRSMQRNSRGRWDGQTLVIDTATVSTHRTFRQTQGLEVSGEYVRLTDILRGARADEIAAAEAAEEGRR